MTCVRSIRWLRNPRAMRAIFIATGLAIVLVAPWNTRTAEAQTTIVVFASLDTPPNIHTTSRIRSTGAQTSVIAVTAKDDNGKVIEGLPIFFVGPPPGFSGAGSGMSAKLVKTDKNGVAEVTINDGGFQGEIQIKYEVPLPPPPAVFMFRGGTTNFNGTHWGGSADRAEALCEGLIRQTLGLLDECGNPVAVPPAQQIKDSIVKDANKPLPKDRTIVEGVIGIMSADKNYRAFNLDIAAIPDQNLNTKNNDRQKAAIIKKTPRPFSRAVEELNKFGLAANANVGLYTCGHGNSGLIFLGQGDRPEATDPEKTAFQGFFTGINGYKNGTNKFPADKTANANAGNVSNNANPPYSALPQPPLVINSYIHHCFSNLKPDKKWTTHSVADTLATVSKEVGAKAKFTIAHAHDQQAQVGDNRTLTPTVALNAQQDAAVRAVFADNTIAERQRFPTRLSAVQQAIDAALPAELKGKVPVCTLYSDAGDVAGVPQDPPGESVFGLCSSIGGFSNCSATIELTGPSGPETVPLTGQCELATEATTVGDFDNDGLDETPIELLELNLTGFSANLGPITVTRRETSVAPFGRTQGQLREALQIVPGHLDIPPFCDPADDPACQGTTAEAFFDVFLDIAAPDAPSGSVRLHNQSPTRISTILSDSPSGDGETFDSSSPTPLVDDNGGDSPVDVTRFALTPDPEVTCSFDANNDGTPDLVLDDEDGNGFCEFPENKTHRPGTLRFTKDTPVEFTGTTLIEFDTIIVEEGAVLLGEPSRLRTLTLFPVKGDLVSRGTLALTASDDLVLNAQKSIDLGGDIALDAGDQLLLDARGGKIAIQPDSVNPANFSLIAGNLVSLTAKSAIGNIAIERARIGSRRVIVNGTSNTLPKGPKGVTIGDNALITTDPALTGLGAGTDITLNGALGAGSGVGPAGVEISDGSKLVPGRNLVFTTKLAGDDVCLSNDVTLQARGAVDFTYVRDTVFEDGTTTFLGKVKGGSKITVGGCQ